jgi:Serine/threonine protein phosphatase
MNGALEIVNVSDVGRKRPHNEDSTISDLRNGLVILADGMGGYKAGEVASAIAVVTVLEDVLVWIKDKKQASRTSRKKTTVNPQANQEGQIIKTAIKHANSNIYQMAKTDEQCQGMGTTIVTGLFHEDKLSIGHVGDSRLYRFRANQLQQITKDHSLIQELIDRGLYTPEEANAKMPKNLVTRGLGWIPRSRLISRKSRQHRVIFTCCARTD